MGGTTRKGDNLSSYDKNYYPQSHYRATHSRKRECSDTPDNRDPLLYSSDIPAADLSLSYAKRNKYGDYDSSSLNSSQNKSRSLRSENKHHQINLSEYTNNAMKSEQYFSKRFIQKDGVGSDNEPQGNQIFACDICGNEFPRYEFLLTHRRKHKGKQQQQQQHVGVDGGEEQGTSMKLNGEDDIIVGDNKITDPTTAFVNSNSPEMSRSGGGESQQHRHGNTSSHYDQLMRSSTAFEQSGRDTIPIVVPQPPQQPRFSDNPAGLDLYKHSSNISAENPSSSVYPLSAAGVGNENSIDAIKPGVDGKFRPFICENCGQRFTRKDSLVRHAKKQTCYEEQIDLKCKYCEKPFRYHKSLIQHQESAHGISREEQSKSNPVKNSDDDDTDSDRSYEKMDLNIPPLSRSSQQQQHQQHHEEKENTSYSQLMESEKKFRSSNTLLDPSSKSSYQHHHQQQPWPSSSSSSVAAARGVGGSSFNTYSKLIDPTSSSSIPSMAASGSGVTPKFIPPARDEKMRKHHQMDPSSSASAPSSNNNSSQDGQYIGYCTVARPFQCEYCGDRFAHRHSLKRHIRRHLGIGIPCVECGKLYRDQSEWRRHQKSIHNRHYEKYEVPSRISYRDGMENGMIGVVPSTEYHFEHNEGSDSEKSDEGVSMVKMPNSKKFPTSTPSFSSSSNKDNTNEFHTKNERLMDNNSTSKQQPSLGKGGEGSPSYENNTEQQQHQEDDENNSRHSTTTTTTTSKTTTFNFNKLNNPPPEDKDSRKSALDRYLQSTIHSDDEGDRVEDHDDHNIVDTTATIPNLIEDDGEDDRNIEEDRIEVEEEEMEDQMGSGSRDGDGDTSRESIVEPNNNNNNNNTEETSNNNNNNNDTKFSSFHDNSTGGGCGEDGSEIVVVVGDGH